MNTEALSQLYEAAKLQYTPQQIGQMLALDPEEVEAWMLDHGSDFYKTYWRGYYETDLQFRNSVYKLALAGSSPAQGMVKRLQEENSGRRFYE